ncbi:hypothetical protein [Rhodovulum sulfidophilum]|uniref:hypothetical protein n=1 Tax=Rhodovulum sulfidophilum TaxID=35806 RepID=UPI001F4777D8|nr:hypothetical protein [Rhodovulum sulfidophilum]
MQQAAWDLGGTSPDVDLKGLVLSGADLASLESARETFHETISQDKIEARETAELKERVIAATEAIQDGGPQDEDRPRVADILLRFDAETLAPAYAAAQQAIADMKIKARRSLAALSFAGVTFDHLPACPTSRHQATSWAERYQDLLRDLRTTTEKHDEHLEDAEARESQAKSLARDAKLVSDAEADADAENLRARRDARWAKHLAALDRQTAADFHEAMQGHDIAAEARLAHGGEVAMNYCMRDAEGFEGNGQTLRLLARLENFSAAAGANLSRRSMLGVLKYPVALSGLRNPELCPQLQEGPSDLRTIDLKASTPPKGYLDSETDIVDWILEPLCDADRDAFTSIEKREGKHARTLHKSLDCSIMDLADDIACGVHDLEDAIALRLVTERQFRGLVPKESCKSFVEERRLKGPTESNAPYETMVNGLFGDSNTRKRWISRWVNHLITPVCFIERPEFQKPLLRWRVELPEGHARFLKALKGLVMQVVIRNPGVQHLEFKGNPWLSRSLRQCNQIQNVCSRVMRMRNSKQQVATSSSATAS